MFIKKYFPKGSINLMANVCFHKTDHHLQIAKSQSLSEAMTNGAYCLQVLENKSHGS